MPKQGLSSIGIKVTLKENELNFVTSIGDIGGETSSLDATCLKDKMSKSVPGVQKNDGFNIEFLYDNTDAQSDYRVIKSFEGEIVPIVVDFPDGTKFTNSGYVNAKINGAKVDELIGATAKCDLQGEWAVTDPTE